MSTLSFLPPVVWGVLTFVGKNLLKFKGEKFGGGEPGGQAWKKTPNPFFFFSWWICWKRGSFLGLKGKNLGAV